MRCLVKGDGQRLGLQPRRFALAASDGFGPLVGTLSQVLSRLV